MFISRELADKEWSSMKYVKIFLASSVAEFEKERREWGDYICSLNNIYVKREIYFELNLCEDLNNAISKECKQEQHNHIIRDSQYFYIFFWKMLEGMPLRSLTWHGNSFLVQRT